MAFDKFDIFFSGKTLADTDIQKVRIRIGKMFNASPAHLEKLFSGKTIKIKTAVDIDAANKYREAFHKAGAIVDIQATNPVKEQPQNKKETEEKLITTQSAPDFELLPASTGSMEGFRPIIEKKEIPHTLDLAIDESDKPIDTHQPVPDANIDISELSAAPANSGSLEEFEIKKEIKPLPDISHLQIK